ncbi:MAG: 30S ribosomal protein S16 [Bacteroidetes bacterium]|nr:30S ribosomal protein S16 [Bacteroidota bacterium]
MPAKLRLQRYGKKGYAFYHIVVADARAPRDGKYIEKLGVYNPNTNPATVELDADKALTWLQNGAQPTDTMRAILSYKGVLYKRHLHEGVKKGALTQEMADAKFEKWLSDKNTKIDNKKVSVADKRKAEMKDRMAAESQVKDARAKKIAEAALAKMTGGASESEAPAQETPAAEENA